MLRTAFILTPALLCSGCVILPIPHRRVHEYGVVGKITRPDDNPIVGARVASVSDETKFVESDAEGKFIIPPEYGWHGGMLFGPISMSVWPGLDVVSPERKITISAQGFESQEVEIGGSAKWFEMEGNSIKSAPIKLIPKLAAPPAKNQETK